MEIATIRTGEETWAVVISDTRDFLEETILECVVMSKKKWPDNQIRITGLSEEKIKELKRKAFKQ